MIFTFWSGSSSDRGHNQPAIDEWHSNFRKFRVFGDDDARDALGDYADLYDAIRIPACKSDIARLALLLRFGGLYVDAHTGTADPWRLAETLSLLAYKDVVLFDHRHSARDAGYHIVNTALAARRDSGIIWSVLQLALESLVTHREREGTSEAHVEYDIASLTGSGAIMQSLFTIIRRKIDLKEKYADRIAIVPLEPIQAEIPFHFYKHYGYRAPGRHWSERQLTEPLFNKSESV